MYYYQNYLMLCNERGISPSKAGIEAGVTKTSISNWSNGKSKPNAANITKIATYFNVPVEYFTEEKRPTVQMGDESAYYLEMFMRSASLEQLQNARKLITNRLLGE